MHTALHSSHTHSRVLTHHDGQRNTYKIGSTITSLQLEVQYNFFKSQTVESFGKALKPFRIGGKIMPRCVFHCLLSPLHEILERDQSKELSNIPHKVKDQNRSNSERSLVHFSERKHTYFFLFYSRYQSIIMRDSATHFCTLKPDLAENATLGAGLLII